MRRWYYRLPGSAYANGPTGPFASEREARAYLREIYDLVKLPRGTEVWPADDMPNNDNGPWGMP